jgi:hypothetical protein
MVARTRRRGSGPEPARRFTLGDIALKTGVEPRLLQFWADSRLILPEGADEHPGRGRAREFSDAELQTASLLGPLASGGIPIGRLRTFAYIFRGALTGEAPPKQRMVGGAILDNVELRRVLGRAASGTGVNFCVISFASDGRSIVETMTDEKGPPMLDLLKFFQLGFPRGEAFTVVISLTERLATLFNRTQLTVTVY